MAKTEKKQSVMKSAMAMSLGTLASRVLGLVRDQVIYALFSRTVTDAFVVAFRLPNMFRRVLGEGALSVSFIPVFVEEHEKDKVQAKILASVVFSLLAAVSSLLCVFGVLFMEPLLEFVLSGKGYTSVAGKMNNTIFLARIMFSYLFLVSTYAFYMSLLQSLKRFFVPAVAPAFFNFVFIVFACLPKEWGRVPGETLAWGVIAAGLGQVIVVLLPLLKLGYLPKLHWNFKVKGLNIILRNMVPGIIGMGILQLMGLVNLSYASRLSEGARSYIYLADRILELPQSLIAISIGAAILPTLSALWSRGEKSEMRDVGQKHMKLLMVLALPSAVGMYVLAEPLVDVLFGRGRFTASDVAMTASVVQVYAFLLLALSLNKVTVPSFYAIQNTWLPAVTSAIALIVHVVLAHFMVNEFGLLGLIGSMCVAGYLNLSLVLIAYRKLIGEIAIFSLLKTVVTLLPGAIVMGFGVYYFHTLLSPVFVEGLPLELARILMILMTVSLGGALYFFINIQLKQPETTEVWGMISRRFRGR